MRIAYIYEFDAADINVQSGHPSAILRQFERLGHQVTGLFPLSRRHRHLYWPHRAVFKSLGKTYRPDREKGYLRSLARQVERRLEGVEYDVAFAPGSHVAAEVNLRRPLVFCADASFASVIDRYADFSRCAVRFLRLGHRQDRMALQRCAAAIYPSAAAANEASTAYGADPSKLHVVPFGANVDVLPVPTVHAAIQNRTARPFRILLIGRDWPRKGGDLVVAACAMLAERGIPIQLDIVGPRRVPADLPPFAKNHGFLDKSLETDRVRVLDLLLRADVFFMPSRAEAYGMALCEALACGVPVVSTAVGGIPTIVRNGVNGYLLPLTASAEDYTAPLETLFYDESLRRRLSFAALADFRERLSWDSFGSACEAILADVCRSGSATPGANAVRRRSS